MPLQFSEMLTQISKQLSEGRPMGDATIASSELMGMWSRGTETAEVHPSTSTGVLLQLASKGRVIHERYFAASEVSVPRIARAITEHLTGYLA
jgi:hypothetical protein